MVLDNFWGSFSASVLSAEPTDSAIKFYLEIWRRVLLYQIGIYPRDRREVCRVIRAQFKKKRNVKSSKRFVRQTPYWGEGNIYVEPKMGPRDTTPFYRHIHENLGRCWGPEGQNVGARMICGQWDPLAKDEVLEQWISVLPQLKGRIKRFKDVSHFVELVKPEEVAEAIIDVSALK